MIRLIGHKMIPMAVCFVVFGILAAQHVYAQSCNNELLQDCLEEAETEYDINEADCYASYTGQRLTICLENAESLYSEDRAYCYNLYG